MGDKKGSLSSARKDAKKATRATEAGTTCATCTDKPCKVEVRANALSLGSYHLFIVFTNQEGKEYFFRGGPSGGGPSSSSGVSGELSGGSSRNGSESTSGSGSNTNRASDSGGSGPYGYIVTTHGDYVEGTIDYEVGAPSVVINHSAAACAMYDKLIGQMAAIDAAKIRYAPLGPNSNSVVYTALKNVGLTPAVPSGVWAPGKDTPLKLK